MAKSDDLPLTGGNKQLLSFVERIERLEEEKKTIADDIKDVYGEAKGTGYDTKVLKKIIADRKKEAEELSEFETLVESYRRALGMRVHNHYDDEAEQGIV